MVRTKPTTATTKARTILSSKVKPVSTIVVPYLLTLPYLGVACLVLGNFSLPDRGHNKSDRAAMKKRMYAQLELY